MHTLQFWDKLYHQIKASIYIVSVIMQSKYNIYIFITVLSLNLIEGYFCLFFKINYQVYALDF